MRWITFLSIAWLILALVPWRTLRLASVSLLLLVLLVGVG